MSKASEVFKKIRFAKGESRGKPHLSTDDEEHGAVGEVEWNQQLDHQKKRAMQEKVDKPTGELKDACWKGYTAVGMKEKNGKKVPNCVPTNESKDMKSARIIKDLYKKKGVSDQDKWKAEYKKARDAGSSSSNAKARANGAVYEEVEQIDEISKKTLGSYVSKAASSLSQASASSSHKRTKASVDYDDNIRRGMKKKDADAHLNRGYDSAKPDIQKVLNRVQGIKKAASRLSKEEVEQVEEGAFKNIATDREEDARLAKSKSWKKETPWMKVKNVVTDKSGAKHGPMSRARDLARKAAIVKEAADKAKAKKKEKKVSDDTYQAEPELSSQIIRND